MSRFPAFRRAGLDEIAASVNRELDDHPTPEETMTRFPTTRDGAPRVRHQVLAHDVVHGVDIVDEFPTALEAEREAEALEREHARDPFITFTTKRIER